MTHQGDGLHREAGEERAAIVAWLQAYGETLVEAPVGWRVWKHVTRLFMAAGVFASVQPIERGDHLKLRDAAASGEVGNG